MSAQLPLLPIISIDSDEVREWLERQLLHLLHKSRPKFIPQASFNTIITPDEVHQADVLYTRHIKSGRTIYLFYLNLVDVASRYKATVPIGVALRGTAKSIKNIQGILTSTTIAKCLEKIYDDPENPLIWPKVFLSDKSSEFKGECKKLLRKHGVEIQKAKSKKTIGIAERYNLTFQKQFYSFLDAHDLLDFSSDIIKLEDLPSPMGYDEKRLSYGNSVIYLLDSSEYEGGRRRATDMNWSSKIYNICESLVQKNQLVLYWLEDNEGNGLERSFVREELQIIPPDIEYSPQWVLAI
ncbi:hypothetical protein RCL_jg6576.t1 [Rhizophagus clarus]|uniref:Integrase catalytic domain-containing protein n=2 Tax=Rhizophagus clarus TaxID=94130 RepID=A0A8H3LFX6_9GLOM|nr:hypothetical protein RCL_jg6576.t1 [Rhizophagus clarus]